MSLLADSLKGLASISLQTIAEQTFANEIVRPFMEKVKMNLILVLKKNGTDDLGVVKVRKFLSIALEMFREVMISLPTKKTL